MRFGNTSQQKNIRFCEGVICKKNYKVTPTKLPIMYEFIEFSNFDFAYGFPCLFQRYWYNYKRLQKGANLRILLIRY